MHDGMRCARLPGTSLSTLRGIYHVRQKYQRSSHHSSPSLRVVTRSTNILCSFGSRLVVVLLPELRFACIQSSAMIIGNGVLPKCWTIGDGERYVNLQLRPVLRPRNSERFSVFENQKPNSSRNRGRCLQPTHLTHSWKRPITESHPCIAMCISKVPTNPKGGNKIKPI